MNLLRRLLNTVFFLGLPLLLAACAVPLRVHSPTSPLIDTPETRGKKGKFAAGVQLAKMPEVILSRDLKVTDPDLDRPEMDNEGLWAHLLGQYSVSEIFDIEARLFPGLRGKLQVYRDETLSLAVSFGGSYFPGKTSRDDSSSTAVNVTSYTFSEWGYDGSVQLGYRINPAFLLYGGVLASYGTLSGTYRVDSRGIMNAPFAATVTQWGPSMGVLWSWRFLHSRWGGTVLFLNSQGSSNTFFVAGTEAVFHFGWKDDEKGTAPAGAE